MALTSRGAYMQLKNASDGRVTFDWDATGNPKFSDDPGEVVLSLLLEAPWWGDATGKRRSQLATVNTIDDGTAGRIKQIAEDAVQPAIDSGVLRSASALVTPTATGFNLTLTYKDRAGRPGAQSIPLAV